MMNDLAETVEPASEKRLISLFPGEPEQSLEALLKTLFTRLGAIEQRLDRMERSTWHE